MSCWDPSRIPYVFSTRRLHGQVAGPGTSGGCLDCSTCDLAAALPALHDAGHGARDLRGDIRGPWVDRTVKVTVSRLDNYKTC